MKTKHIFAALLLCILSFASYSQTKKVKFGKVDMDDMTMNIYPNDTSAEAVVLYESGYFSANEFTFTHFYRIKILKKTGYDYANRRLNIDEKTMVRGRTYNLENGKIVETKLEKESIKKERIKGDWQVVHLSMPNVKVGSVVDVEYSFPLLPSEWYFQREIPVKYCELTIEDSQYFLYRKKSYGDILLKSKDATNWYVENVPAFRAEPYLTTTDNYCTRLELEISAITIPGQMERHYCTDWQAVNNRLLLAKYFGEQMGMALYLTDEAKELKATGKTGMDLVEASVNLVKKNMKWNGDNTMTATDNINYIYPKNHKGSSADVNLLLVNLLRKLDIEAYPVILSTRSNGFISQFFATIDKPNYTIALAKINGQEILLDATNENLPYQLLPEKCLNGLGRIVDEKNAGWVDLSYKKKDKTYTTLNISLNPVTSEVSGNIASSYNDYSACNYRTDYRKYTSKDEYIKEIEKNYPGMTITNFSLKNLDTISANISEKITFSMQNKADVIGDKIYFNPFIKTLFNENPFKLENRLYPVEFPYPFDKTIAVSVAIPEGFTIETLPQPKMLSIPSKNAVFSLNYATMNNAIQASIRLQINATSFAVEEYPYLRELFTLMISKQNEQVVLKKI